MPRIHTIVATAFAGHALACKDKSDDSGTVLSCAVENTGEVISLAAQNNYTFQGTLEIATVPVLQQVETCIDETDNDGDKEVDEADECVDLTIDWSALNTDVQRHSMDPVADIDQVAMAVFRYLTAEEVTQGLSENALAQEDLAIFVNLVVEDQTSVQLSDMGLLGNDIDIERYLTADQGTFLLYVASGTSLGVGARMLTFLEPNADETNDTLTITNDSTYLDFTVDLSTAEPIGLSADVVPLVDWSGLSTTGLGTTFDHQLVDGLMVAHYPDLSASDLEGQFLDIEIIAETLYEGEHSGGTEADLSTLTADGVSFSGIDGSGTWLLGLTCSSCANPAPLALSVLASCD